jgi:ABC-type nitrate/sulfonate/bicarbonate transport system permease component
VGRADVVVGAASAMVFVALWAMLARTHVLNTVLVPAPVTVVVTAAEMIREGYPEATPLLSHVAASVARIGAGFGLAVAVAVPAGIVIGTVPMFFDLAWPIVAFFRTLPTVSLIPLAIMALGIGEVSKVALIAVGCFWMILAHVVDGVRLVEPALLRAARALGATRAQTLAWVVLPAAVPRMVTGLRLGLGVAFMVLVAAEMVASESGLGFLIVDGRRFFRTDVVLIGMVLIGALGALFAATFDVIERRLLSWLPIVAEGRR